MARPPRIGMQLPWDVSVVYFITFCVDYRLPVSANHAVFSIVEATIRELRNWNTLVAVLMPDHIHSLTNSIDRFHPPTDFSRLIKRRITQGIRPKWRWQKGCFDRLLRSNEMKIDKVLYILENPVRAGFVRHWRDWPFTYVSARLGDWGRWMGRR